MSPSAFLPPPQRRLFFAIWTLLALALALWALPSPDRWSHDRIGAPDVRFGPELEAIFQTGRVVERLPESLLVEIDVVPAYVETIPPEGRDFSLGYQFRKGSSLLRHGLLPLRLGKASRFRVRLPNPERAYPTEVFLSLLP